MQLSAPVTSFEAVNEMMQAKFSPIAIGALLVACTHPSQGGGEERTGRLAAPVELHSLDSSDPAQLSIMRWHNSLVSGKFEEFAAVQVQGSEKSDHELLHLSFEEMRREVPSAVRARDMTSTSKMLASTEDGFRTFALVGCVMPASGRLERRMAVVNVRQENGKWKVYGGDFSPPSAPFAGDCPIQ
jgi:hypothetical protein